jgi:hypothetical protein
MELSCGVTHHMPYASRSDKPFNIGLMEKLSTVVTSIKILSIPVAEFL